MDSVPLRYFILQLILCLLEFFLQDLLFHNLISFFCHQLSVQYINFFHLLFRHFNSIQILFFSDFKVMKIRILALIDLQFSSPQLSIDSLILSLQIVHVFSYFFPMRLKFILQFLVLTLKIFLLFSQPINLGLKLFCHVCVLTFSCYLLFFHYIGYFLLAFNIVFTDSLLNKMKKVL